MRKIEKEMNQAIYNEVDFRKDNTRVIQHKNHNACSVYLHGNLIATLGENFIQLFDGNYKSNTVKSRLNAILSANCGDFPARVYQKDFLWYVNDNGNIREFESGMVLTNP